MAAESPGEQLDFPALVAPPYIRLDLPDADIVLYRLFLTAADADRHLNELLTGTIPWKQDEIDFYGKTIPVPRLASWHGDPGCAYTYSGIRSEPNPWTESLLQMRTSVEALAGQRFNSVLVNQYRNGSDSVSWHSDDEPELGQNPVIASLSLGATRLFQLKHTRYNTRRTEFELTHGSLLLMRGSTQHHWLHQVPKTRRACGVRVNLTFRSIRMTGTNLTR
jgi:alkylated DNA repair dioxygenase AlkB